MTVDKWVAQAFLQAVGLGDVDAVEELLAPGATWEAAAAGDHPFGGVQSRDQFMGMVRVIRGQFPEGIRYEVHRVVAEGGVVVVEATGDGPVTPDLVYRNRHVFILEVRAGKVVGGREYMDSAYLTAFMAALPRPS
ncbi:nuclear transport factor 2 family protein [Actinosynnema sp. CS-041913]|uniref:nuclear transport factor 2 family protein n=1 Tax=Actinosynnema sp. CS-041913 TaxID=3239917 RepID=UPI003D900FD3